MLSLIHAYRVVIHKSLYKGPISLTTFVHNLNCIHSIHIIVIRVLTIRSLQMAKLSCHVQNTVATTLIKCGLEEVNFHPIWFVMENVVSEMDPVLHWREFIHPDMSLYNTETSKFHRHIHVGNFILLHERVQTYGKLVFDSVDKFTTKLIQTVNLLTHFADGNILETYVQM